jgi:hypothetical protein
MLRYALALLVLIAATSGASAAEDVHDIKATLEGIWLQGRAPDKGDCVTVGYHENQLEFEFEKSGGRVMIFEPPDLFQAHQIADIERDGDGYVATLRLRDGRLVRAVLLRILDRNRIEQTSLAPQKDGAARRPEIIYRCGPPNRSVNADVPMDMLRLLTPETTGSAGFPLTIDGVADREICEGKYLDRLPADVAQGGIQFEVLGPARFWVVMYGLYKPRKIVFDHVLKVRVAGPGVLKLDMEEHMRGAGWKAGGATYELTILDKGDRFEIPEIGKTFLRCEPSLRGMHRWD